MNYSKMSDFEINKRVLSIISGINPLSYAHSADNRSAGIVVDNRDRQWFDFCKSWADSGPIIKEYGISLKKCESGSWFCYSECSNDYRYECRNPLKAAMIVFLMIKGGEE